MSNYIEVFHLRNEISMFFFFKKKVHSLRSGFVSFHLELKGVLLRTFNGRRQLGNGKKIKRILLLYSRPTSAATTPLIAERGSPMGENKQKKKVGK